jgi:hypothetical protein
MHSAISIRTLRQQRNLQIRISGAGNSGGREIDRPCPQYLTRSQVAIRDDPSKFFFRNSSFFLFFFLNFFFEKFQVFNESVQSVNSSAIRAAITHHLKNANLNTNRRNASDGVRDRNSRLPTEFPTGILPSELTPMEALVIPQMSSATRYEVS